MSETNTLAYFAGASLT